MQNGFCSAMEAGAGKSELFSFDCFCLYVEANCSLKVLFSSKLVVLLKHLG